MDIPLARRMLDIVASIPPGSVATYGEIAVSAGSRSPRLVGRVLSEMADDDLPWHRVLPASGRPAPHIAAEQLALLAAEGVLAVDGRISVKQFRDRRAGPSGPGH
ncbi:DNA methyltransferase [Nakamurella antarctica]|uniref:DNA methyltransferase n=1 Tax=Nakamurella antarctica TaxID=1902245 RepID=A0A3G8ZLV7_9ACTN|nr:MGMT family protein [Nakamurella antarctica]AZI58138.1 DNA methyltransferase [Nakamurella antarctica]